MASPNPELAKTVSVFESIQELVQLLIPVAFGAAVLFFFWGLALYILSSNDESKKADGRRIMIYGTIALFVASSIWGLVAFIRATLGVSDSSGVRVPRIDGGSPVI